MFPSEHKIQSLHTTHSLLICIQNRFGSLHNMIIKCAVCYPHTSEPEMNDFIILSFKTPRTVPVNRLSVVSTADVTSLQSIADCFLLACIGGQTQVYSQANLKTLLRSFINST